MKYVFTLSAALALASCAHKQPIVEPQVRIVEVKVAQPVPCSALERLGPEPTYPDTDEAIAKTETIGALARLYAKGRLLRVQRLAEFVAAKTACIF